MRLHQDRLDGDPDRLQHLDDERMHGDPLLILDGPAAQADCRAVMAGRS